MRTIKFRAWDKLAERMQDPFNPFRSSAYSNPGNFEFMQFTGLFDRNGKEIYEGDIVRVHGDAFDVGDEPEFEVKWSKEGGYFMEDDFGGDYLPCLGNDNYELEIIGNIYSNPELLDQPKTV